MDDQKRTKVLGGVLVAVLGFMFIRPDKALMEPIADAERDRSNAQSSFETEEAMHMQLLVARENNSRARATSLPHSISDAQRLYQTWITNLAEQCKFSRLIVAPGRTEFRRGQYLTVNIDIEAETDLEGLSRFMYLFDKVDLMHRISSVEVKSTGSQNNPRMEIVLSAQGMSVTGSPDRSELFPRTHAKTAIVASATEISVDSEKQFPAKPPFLSHVGNELVQVTAVDGNKWTVERGVEGTTAVPHTTNERVQLFPVSPLRRGMNFEDYQTLLAASPFTKPKPPREYRPRIASVTNKTIGPGEEVKMTAKAEDINTDIGAPQFALEEAVEGMTIDAESGDIVWTPAETLPPESYSATVVLTQKNNEELRIEKKFSITIKLPNDPPKITLAATAVAVMGREFQLTATAEDDGPADKLTYAFDGETPEGIAVDAASGAITWIPAKTLQPKEYPVTVKVTDGGSPALSASATVTVKLEDDNAAMTRFTGSVARDGVPSAMFRNLGTNDRPVLSVGDRVKVSEIDAEVKEISSRHVLLADAAGVWKLDLGANLRERTLIEAAPKPEPEPEAKTMPDESAEPPAEKLPVKPVPEVTAEAALPPTAEVDVVAETDTATPTTDQPDVEEASQD